MERIDPAAVQLPRWYRPNPGRAGDLAFIVFSGEGENTRMSRITNRRWAQSAFGTASSAALTRGRHAVQRDADLPPVGADDEHRRRDRGRLAARHGAASSTSSTFWEEVRRYGVTVASYTWTLLDEVVEAPPQPGERHHPLRLFIGSGMPRGLWRRVERRFRPARVVEFYASTEAGAILVNLRGRKPGAMGRPLPGSAEVRIAQYDLDAQGLVARPGRVRPAVRRRRGGDAAGPGQPERATQHHAAALAVLGRRRVGRHRRSVPARRRRRLLAGGRRRRRDPHRRRTGVLDADPRRARRHRRRGPRARLRRRARRTASTQIAVAAVTLRRDASLTAAGPEPARCRRSRREERPAVVHVADRIPVTTWFRPRTEKLREAGHTRAGGGGAGLVPGRVGRRPTGR